MSGKAKVLDAIDQLGDTGGADESRGQFANLYSKMQVLDGEPDDDVGVQCWFTLLLYCLDA